MKSSSIWKYQNLEGVPFTKMFILILAYISNYTHYKVSDEITNPFPNFNGCNVEIWEWIYDFIPNFIPFQGLGW